MESGAEDDEEEVDGSDIDAVSEPDAELPETPAPRPRGRPRKQPDTFAQPRSATCCQQRLNLPTGPTFSVGIAATITAGRAIAVEAPLTTQHAQERVEILRQGRARTRALSLGRAPTALP